MNRGGETYHIVTQTHRASGGQAYQHTRIFLRSGSVTWVNGNARNCLAAARECRHPRRP